MPVIFQRNPNIETRQVEDSLFLVEESKQSLLCLNTLGVGVWNSLAETGSLEKILEIVQQAFPDQPKEVIESDVIELFEQLQKNNLIQPVRASD